MASKKIRVEMIGVLEQSIKRFDKLAEEWTADRLARGWDPHPDKDLSIGYNRMIVSIIHGWLATMKELLATEEKDLIKRVIEPYRKVKKAES
jgi:hypothetical protein